MRQVAISIFFIASIFFNACVDHPPISQEKFAKIYIELQLIDIQYGQQYTLHNEKIDSLLRFYNVSKEEVKSTLEWYNKSPERWKAFFTEVESEVRTKRRNPFIISR